MRNVDSKLFTASSDDINRSADGITSKRTELGPLMISS